MAATTRPPRDASLLAELAAPLNPTSPPVYLQASANGHPDGWYWQPNGANKLAWLGRNVFFAEKALLELLHNE